jgi:AraC-like DNA-binding protein
MQHIEFFDTEHFEKNYHRTQPASNLSHFIDFYWETRFDQLWDANPQGFSDILFPNIGYTYLINLGSPFTMEVNNQKTQMKSDGFLPRHVALECYHQVGNHLFGIKFRISPIIFQKKINFSEYKSSIFPLSYLIEKQVIEQIKNASDFDERKSILDQYYTGIISQFEGSLKPIDIVSEIIETCNRNNHFTVSIEDLSAQYQLSSRTLQRYFEAATSLSSKKTLQILRIRKAVAQLVNDPANFDYTAFGYYDYSHFYKHIRSFLQKNSQQALQSHLELLSRLHQSKKKKN